MGFSKVVVLEINRNKKEIQNIFKLKQIEKQKKKNNTNKNCLKCFHVKRRLVELPA